MKSSTKEFIHEQQKQLFKSCIRDIRKLQTVINDCENGLITDFEAVVMSVSIMTAE